VLTDGDRETYTETEREWMAGWGLTGLAGTCWGLTGLAGTCWDLLGLAGTCWDLLGLAGACLGMWGYVGLLCDVRICVRGFFQNEDGSILL